MSDPINNVTSAMANVEDDVAPEIQRSLPSFNGQVLSLAPGQTAFRGYRLNLGDTRDDKVSLSILRRILRDAVAPVAAKAKTKTGGEYTVSVSSNVWPDDHIYLVAAVTRTDNGVSGK